MLLAVERVPAALGDRLASFLLWLRWTRGADELSSSTGKKSAQNRQNDMKLMTNSSILSGCLNEWGRISTIFESSTLDNDVFYFEQTPRSEDDLL